MKKTDVELRDDVMAELEWEPVIDAAAVGVAAHDGVVTLSGQVDSYFERTRVIAAARGVEGVEAIADEITVKSVFGGDQTDTDVAQAAHTALGANVAVPPGRVQAVVDEGLVTLNGEVDWHYQREAAARSVMHLRGVRGVRNLIRLAERTASAGEVKAKIEAAFKRRAGLDASQIVVHVDGGTVVLEGGVLANFERAMAERVAWGTKGVRSVDDRIRVLPQGTR